MIKPTIRATHAVWRQPGWQLLIIIIILGCALTWAYFRVATAPEERLVVIGAGAAAGIAIWGVVGQWSISSRQLTIQFLRQVETDADFIKALERFNAAASCGDMQKYAHKFQKPADWATLSKKERRKRREEFTDTVQAIMLVLNTDEMIAIGVKSAILDYRLVCTYRRKITINRWNAAKSYVDIERTVTGPHTLWIELQRLATRLEDDPYHMIL